MRPPRFLAALAVTSNLLVPGAGHTQQVPDWLLELKLPNAGAKSIMTPSAWGAAFGSGFVGVGAAVGVAAHAVSTNIRKRKLIQGRIDRSVKDVDTPKGGKD